MQHLWSQYGVGLAIAIAIGFILVALRARTLNARLNRWFAERDTADR